MIMRTIHLFKQNTFALLIFAVCSLIFVQRTSLGANESGEPLTRGPVHEAFAQAVAFEPATAYTIRKTPPEMVEEVPPEISMDGDNVTWIPGYWAWDEDMDDFIWVSGIWRDVPPGRQWVPGYWTESGSSYQWYSGYWTEVTVTETQYLPRPPRSIEVGPNIAQPSPDHSWIPGCWVWRDTRYAWRPGYWAPCRTDWIWVPSHYVCAPRGYVYVDGYWDYGIEARGVLFAPVHFDIGLFGVASFHFSPSIVIDLSVVIDDLFIRPSYCHYYFGDYYDRVYLDVGYYPCFSYYDHYRGYDPIYAHRRWENRYVENWEVNIENNYNYRRDNYDARPKHTYAKEREYFAEKGGSERGYKAVAAPLNDFAARKESPKQFKSLGGEEREKFGRHEKEVKQFRDERQKLETQAAAPSKSSDSREKKSRVSTAPLSKSPIMGKPMQDFGEDRKPPKSHDVPKVDDSIRPRSSRSEGKSDQDRGSGSDFSRGKSSDSHKSDSDRGSKGSSSQGGSKGGGSGKKGK
jgi:hypothetical protein